MVYCPSCCGQVPYPGRARDGSTALAECVACDMAETWHHVYDALGEPGVERQIAEAQVSIACSGSTMIQPHAVFGGAALAQAGTHGYVLVRDPTCRLFGYHGLMDDRGGFSLDHMFGF